jgi:hypothetical protein
MILFDSHLNLCVNIHILKEINTVKSINFVYGTKLAFFNILKPLLRFEALTVAMNATIFWDIAP